MPPIPPKFKVGDAVKWIGKLGGAKGVLAEGIVSNLPKSGTRYEVFITTTNDKTLTAASYFVESSKLQLL